MTTRVKLSAGRRAYTGPVTARRSRLVPTTVREELADALTALRRSVGVPDEFSQAALAEADAAARSVSRNPAQDALADLREIEFLTIDPEGATDLDQALHLTKRGNGATLHYAIADLPAYVRPGGALDAEARERGQTFYAPDGRIPLHPTVLSEDAASLLPGHDRRAFVWRFDLDEGARPTRTTLTRAVVRSRRQWSYTQAQGAIDNGECPETLALLPWFGRARAERERERGGVSLNLPETRAVADETGYRVEQEEGVPLEDWNAQVSLLTGMSAAEIMIAGRVGILRTMPPAHPDDIEEFRTRTVALGLPWRPEVTYGDYVRSLDRSPRARAVKEYAAGLFRGAGYVAFDGDLPDQTLQAAIGAPYAHATAPLRRLVDRWTLVVCDALVHGREIPAAMRQSLPELPGIMARSSQRAGQLSAGAIDRVEAAVLQGREGEVFAAFSVSERAAGTRVQLVDPPVDAAVDGLHVGAGSPVALRLRRADVASGQIEFAAAEAAG